MSKLAGSEEQSGQDQSQNTWLERGGCLLRLWLRYAGSTRLQIRRRRSIGTVEYAQIVAPLSDIHSKHCMDGWTQIGGPWPDNEPAVSCMDWKTGQVNAKYYAIQMLAQLGAGPKSFLKADVHLPPPPSPPPSPPHQVKSLADCVAKAKSCKMANFVSYSSKNHDCSWYQHCNITSTFNPTGDYESEVIKAITVSTSDIRVAIFPHHQRTSSVHQKLPFVLT